MKHFQYPNLVRWNQLEEPQDFPQWLKWRWKKFYRDLRHKRQKQRHFRRLRDLQYIPKWLTVRPRYTQTFVRRRIFRRRVILLGYRLRFFFSGRKANTHLAFFPKKTTKTSLHLSMGQVPSYFHKKKRKKTFFAGVDLFRAFYERMKTQKVPKTFFFYSRNRTPVLKGILYSFTQAHFIIVKAIDRTRCVHNGTRLTKPRRL